MLNIISIVCISLMLLSGCISQNNQSFGDNFDQLKAAQTRVSLGLTYLKNGNFSQAKFNLDKALEFAPRSADANFAMAYYYQSVNELEQAESAYQFAMDLEPKNANIANSYGAFLCQNGDYENAKTYFLKAVNTSSYISSAETYENLALCSRSQGQPEDAIQYLRNAVNHQPGRANSLFLLTRSLVEAQQWQEAREILRRYEKIAQISPQSLLMAMQIESGIGNDTAAKGYSEMLLRMYPNDPVTKTMLTDQEPPLEIEKKTTKLSILSKDVNTASELLESQPVEKPSEVVATTPEKKILLVNGKDDKIETDDITETSAAVAEQQPEQVTQEESEILAIPELHIVASGENLYRISLLYNIKMQRLIDWNGLADASAIFEGKKLFLVAPSVVE
ncbi:type IV pilus biogenesis/stability protein PilW [Paraglaciecola sp. MB-3u-78]|uniref:type IV pilus biogenesis/stability protein PilW n=1 Tax=Paraglaciecola sp. MB-3u-78 TaxID=2058332 RepID=UPI000C33C2AA|nr:type IV pilus biogenesis/stability protein PilW [Paraglaciecola sp. MB-3u-78]PKH00605.1 type IV pilus biogenesis/stability protein PilW [Paraglaciecola sp. MB-3u-78]